MQTQYKHIRFDDYPRHSDDKRKTKRFMIFNRSDVYIGEVSWQNGWRQYCFFPASGTVFSRSCLADIQHFIQQLVEERK